MTSAHSTAHSSPASASSASPDLSPLNASVRRFHGWEPLRIEGELPRGLRGTLVRAGPGLMERFGRRLLHSFEADGALIGLRIGGDGSVDGAVRVVESAGYRAEEAAGKPLYGSAAPWWRRFTNGLRQRIKETGNTSVLSWQGRAFALMEGGRPMEIDPNTLRSLGASDLGGVVGQAFSAHPHRLDARGVTYNFGQTYGPKPTIELYALPDKGQPRRLGEVAVPFNTMIHDFAVTDHYLVFVLSSLRLKLGRALLAPKDMVSLMDWYPEGAAVMLVPIDDVSAPVRIPIAPRFVFHLVNAFERGDEVVVDVIQYPDLSVMTALSRNDPDTASPPRLQRLVVAPKARRLRSDELLWEKGCEFPVMPARSVGREYADVWMVTGEEDQATGVVRYNVSSQDAQVWTPGEGIVPAEGVFVAKPEAERDEQGWIISLVCDGWAEASYWAVLDSERIADGPVAKIWMDQPLPQTFHGAWIAGA